MENAKPPDLGDSSKVDGFSYLLRMPLPHYRKLPPIAGVYFLHTAEGFILYIGSSNNINTRVRSHVGYWRRNIFGIGPLWIAWLPTSTVILRGLEDHYILLTQPPLNGIHKGLHKRGKPSKYKRKYPPKVACELAKSHCANFA